MIDSPVVCVGVALLVSAASSVGAQSRTASRDTVRLAPIVVTATKSDAAPSVSTTVVLQGAALRERGVATVGDALREVAGVHLAQSGSPGATTSLFVRGGQSNYLKVLVDGVSVNEAGGFVDAANFTTDNVERIEVVRGPASVLYGSDAVSGVVQIFTRAADAGLRVDASVRGGATAHKRGRHDGAIPVGGRAGLFDAVVDAGGGSRHLGWTLGAARHEHQGILAFNNAWSSSTVSGALRLAPDGRSALRLSGRLIDGRYEYPTDGAGTAVDSNAVRDERRIIAGVEADRQLSPRATLRVLAGTHELRGVSSDQPDSRGDSTGYYYRTANDNYRRTLESRIELRIALDAIATAGVEGQWQGETSVGASRFAEFPEDETNFEERRRNVGYFAQLAGISRALSWSVGVRADDNEKFGAFGTWRAGVALDAPAAFRIRGSIGTAFKEPSFIEVFSTAYTRGNASLRPERSLAWELGVERRVAALTLGATWFDQRFRDMIQYRGQPTTSQEPHYFNIARATSRGLELEARTDEQRALHAAASFTALRTRVIDAGFQSSPTDNFVLGRRLLRRPDRQASVSVGWRPTSHARVAAAVLHVGSREDRDFTGFPAEAVVLEPYTRVDLSGELDVPPRHAESPVALTVRVDNALNASYEEIRNFAVPGRTLYLGVRLHVRR